MVEIFLLLGGNFEECRPLPPHPPLVLDLLEKMVFITSVKIDIFCFLFGGNPRTPRYDLFYG